MLSPSIDPGDGAGSNPKGKFVLQREELKCLPAMLTRADYTSAAAVAPPASGAAGRLSVFESHGDQVLALPPGAETLATSDSAEVEVWALGEDVLAWQGHPELSAEAMVTKIVPYIRQLSEAGGASSCALAHHLVRHVVSFFFFLSF